MTIGIHRAPSNQERYDLFWSGDDALIQPPPQPSDANDLAAIAAWDAATKEHERKLIVARETGDWTGLVVNGATATKFVLRQIPGHVKRKLQDRYAVIGLAEMTSLVFRLAVVDIVSLAVKLEFEHHAEFGKIATNDVPDYLDEHAPGCVSEIAAEVFRRMNGLSKKAVRA